MALAEFATPVINSVVLGSFVALMALGLTLTFAVTRVLNIAHAEYVTMGAYTLTIAVNHWQWSVFPAVVLAVVVGAVTAVLTDALVFRPMIKRGAHFLYILVASIGVGMVLRHVVYLVADSLNWLSVKARVMVSPVWRIGYGTVTDLVLWVVPTAIVCAVALIFFLQRTRMGRSMRAVASNLMLAQSSGVRVARTRLVAWLISGGLAGLAGALWAVYAPITPEMGWVILLRVVAASILGGLTGIGATIGGAYIVGFGENLGIFVAREWLGVPLEFRSIITFLIIIVVLLVRPAGLQGLRLRFGRGKRGE